MNLAENPICNIPNYRIQVLKVLPWLDKLDDIAVTVQEVNAAQNTSYDALQVESGSGKKGDYV